VTNFTWKYLRFYDGHGNFHRCINTYKQLQRSVGSFLLVFGEFEVMVLMLIYYLYFVGGACLLLFVLMLLALNECMTGLSYGSVYFVAFFFF